MQRALLASCSLVLVLGCLPRLDGAPCATDDNCPRGQACVVGEDGGTCVAAGLDGGSAGGGGGGGSNQVLEGDPLSHDFGLVPVGGTAPFTFRVRNASAGATGTLGLQVTGDQAFEQLSSTCQGGLDPDAACEVTVAFAPSAEGPFEATLQVTASPGGTLSLPLSGTGLGGSVLALSPSSHDFGLVGLGQPSAPVHVTVRNTSTVSTGPLSVLQGGTDAQDVLVTASSCLGALASQDTCSFDVQLGPSSLGGKAGTVTVSAVPGGSSTLTVTGDGVAAAQLASSPASVHFPDTAAGTTGPSQTFTIGNRGVARAPGPGPRDPAHRRPPGRRHGRLHARLEHL